MPSKIYNSHVQANEFEMSAQNEIQIASEIEDLVNELEKSLDNFTFFPSNLLHSESVPRLDAREVLIII